MLPIALRPLAHRDRAVVIGGGSVALRKVEALKAAGYTLSVVALVVDARFHALLDGTSSTIALKAYHRDDLTGAALVIAATDDDDVNARVVADARANGMLVCDARTPELGDFTMLATTRVGDVTFAVDSGASTPAFSKRIVSEISAHFGPAYGMAARTLARMRTYARAVLDENDRAEVMRELAQAPIARLAAMNPLDAEHEVEATYERLHTTSSAPETASVVCASRASALAMTQTRTVAARLAERGIASTILPVTTTGDRVNDRPLAAIGSVNVFVKEIEVALRERRADYAVHSCKDLPGALDADMRLAAISTREDPRDAFCSERFASFDALPAGAIVGTSSLRRRALLAAKRPDVRFEEIRGNVDTRLRKLRDGEYDAIVLAMAGLNRLRVHASVTVPFSVDDLVPAVAQGALAIETRADDDVLAAALREALNDDRSERAVACERAALRTLRAGCNAPLGIHAWFDDAGQLVVCAAYAGFDTHHVVRERMHAPAKTLAEAEALGVQLGEALRVAMEEHSAR